MSNRQLFFSNLGQTSAFPMGIEVERAEGIYLYGPDNKKYIDLISGIAVSSLGHQHPRIIRAVEDQVKRHMHVMVYGEFVQSPQVQLARALADTLPEQLSNVFFVNSGSEAIEGAMKLAKRFTGRHKFIAFKNAYHGATHGALSLNSAEYFKQAFMPLLPGIDLLDFGDISQLEAIDESIAAVVIEPVQGEAGVRIAEKEFYQKLRQKCDDAGTLLIADEIQSGFGRTGTFWAFEQLGFVPDVLTTAKAMGGGMPLGAFISSTEIMKSLQTNPVLGHITTFGGHPVSCAASLAALNELQESGIYTLASKKADLFKSLLVHEKILEIRNLGLMMAVQFDSFEIVQKIIHRSMEAGIITDWFLHCDSAIRIAPPLIITEEQIKECCRILLSVLDKC
ncbi:MAG: aspartate aminotransferase family protein [Cyclobacteriaceae bacterium]|nr:aspartate aminotransferase family protein [Cyclobacteriaceae bacterium]